MRGSGVGGGREALEGVERRQGESADQVAFADLDAGERLDWGEGERCERR